MPPLLCVFFATPARLYLKGGLQVQTPQINDLKPKTVGKFDQIQCKPSSPKSLNYPKISFPNRPACMYKMSCKCLTVEITVKVIVLFSLDWYQF